MLMRKMITTINGLFRRLSFLESLISICSILVGLYLLYFSIYHIIAYHFSSILFFIMLPMTSLISDLMLGILILYSGYGFIRQRMNSINCYKFSGIFIMLYAFNMNILDFLKNDWTINSLNDFWVFPFGLFLLMFFRQKKYNPLVLNSTFFRLESTKFAICLTLFILIDTCFFNWNYLNRIL